MKLRMERTAKRLMIQIDNRQDKYKVTSELEELVTAAVDNVLKYESFEKPAEVSIVFTDDEGIRVYNKQFRGKDSATDVLSFPMLDYDDGYEDDGEVEVGVEDLDLENGEVVLGDIVISLERAQEQAKEYGHSFEREAAYLTVHSMLHLLGYDHMEDDDAKIMRQKEEDVLTAMNLVRDK